MRILQVVLPGVSEYEAKCQRVDFEALSPKHEIAVARDLRDGRADIAHVYGPSPLPNAALRGLSIPYVASSAPARRTLPFGRAAAPRIITSPVAPFDPASTTQLLPEAVEEKFFSPQMTSRDAAAQRIVGSFRRAALMNIVQQTVQRISRFRDDVAWHLFDSAPSPDDLAGVDLWVDPAIDESDFDGFVAEAIAAGMAVVASRTEINTQRLEKGRTGFLVPCADPNELTHAILGALFKPEVARTKIEAAKQTAGKFRPRQRLRVLERIYETVIP